LRGLGRDPKRDSDFERGRRHGHVFIDGDADIDGLARADPDPESGPQLNPNPSLHTQANAQGHAAPGAGHRAV
jgi:hypothetical protein